MLADRQMSVIEAFRLADDVLRDGVQGISDLVTMTGLINLDFADVKAVMQNAGTALMAVGEGHGDGRAVAAARAAITSPLLDVSIEGAKGVLINVSGGPDLTLAEVTEAAETIQASVDPDANIFFGAVIHPRVQDDVRVTVIATGLRKAAARSRPSAARQPPTPPPAPAAPPPMRERARDPEPPPRAALQYARARRHVTRARRDDRRDADAEMRARRPRSARAQRRVGARTPAFRAPPSEPRPTSPQPDGDDRWDVPAFLGARNASRTRLGVNSLARWAGYHRPR